MNTKKLAQALDQKEDLGYFMRRLGDAISYFYEAEDLLPDIPEKAEFTAIADKLHDLYEAFDQERSRLTKKQQMQEVSLSIKIEDIPSIF